MAFCLQSIDREFSRRRFQLAGAPILLLAMASAGCQPDPNAPSALQLRALDFNDFACQVQPVTAARCSMNACHGVADHAFRVYSPGKLRLTPQTTLATRDAPITMSEVMANFASARGLAPVSYDTSQVDLLRKPLDPGAGGGEHKGGVIFHSVTDAGYVAIANWLNGATLPAGCDLLTQLKMNP